MNPQDLEKLNRWDALSAEEQQNLKKKICLMYWAQFHEENRCLLYGIWVCLAGLILCAGYRAFTGGDWITPMLGLAWLIGLGVVSYIIGSLG